MKCLLLLSLPFQNKNGASWTAPRASVKCQWRTFNLAYDIESSKAFTWTTGSKCRPESIKSPRCLNERMRKKWPFSDGWGVLCLSFCFWKTQWVSVSVSSGMYGWGIFSIYSTHLCEFTRRLQTRMNQMFGTATFAIDETSMKKNLNVNPPSVGYSTLYKSREAWMIFYVHWKARDGILAWDGWIKESPNQKTKVALTGTTR